MYKIHIRNTSNTYEYEELIKEFLRPNQYQIIEDDDYALEDKIIINEKRSNDKNEIKRELFEKLSSITDYCPEWGILTGVRPVKLAGEKYEILNDKDKTINYLLDEYLLNREKANLIVETYLRQKITLGRSEDNKVGVYIGIPFCPSRCLYCSFASNQKPDEEIQRYLGALYKEISYVGKKIKQSNLEIESIYIGGGTPTTLNVDELRELIHNIKESMDITRIREFTIEAGRPDTITKEKLQLIKNEGIDRISINPQTMKDETLELIGRHHTIKQIEEAFELAKEVEISVINADLIAGLPGESLEDFINTLNRVIELAPKNITVHTLAVKRASKLKEIDEDFHYKQGEVVRRMLEYSKSALEEEHYVPYYLYRQKHMAGSFENIGYSKENTDSIYNIRIMGEKQTIIALGAGGISKRYFPQENRLERIPNVTNYEIYISRIDEMISRKEKNLFAGGF